MSKRWTSRRVRQTVIDSRTAGSRAASRVRIVNTPEQPTSFAGRTGTVVKVEGTTVFVRFAIDALNSVTFPFGISNVKETK